MVHPYLTQLVPVSKAAKGCQGYVRGIWQPLAALAVIGSWVLRRSRPQIRPQAGSFW
jgi:hypothetical protein